MNLAPLLLREMQVALRRPGTMRLRLAAGGLSMFASSWGVMMWSLASPARAGSNIFDLLGHLSFGLCVLAGTFLMADSVSRERREGTLPLLLLTGLTPRELAVGKVLGKAIVPFYTLIAILPALAISVLLGGVGAGEFWRIIVALGNALFFFLSLALLASVFCETQRLAYSASLFGSAVFALFFPMWSGLSALGPGWGILDSLATAFSPSRTYQLAKTSAYYAAPSGFWISLICTHVMGWGFILLAGGRLARTWRKRAGTDEPRVAAVAPAKSVVRIGERNPIEWMIGRTLLTKAAVWVAPAIAVVLLMTTLPSPVGSAREMAAFLALVALHLILQAQVAADACQGFMRDRNSGALELLLGTPLQWREITDGIWRAFRRRFGWVAAVLGAVDLVLAVEHAGLGRYDGAFILLILVAGHAIEILAMFWVGLWQGLAATNAAVALLATLWRGQILPWIWTLLCIGVWPRSGMLEVAGMWFVVTGVTCGICLSNARGRLETHYRELAVRPFGVKPPSIESKWSPINWDEERPSGSMQTHDPITGTG
jgi:ABC-type transport system involved in multi-copper enzyme maturation permease subunit